MRATVMYGAHDVRVETVPDARIVEPTDALVRVTRACICGSDLWPYNSMTPNTTGNRMGHEFIGVVAVCGPGGRDAGAASCRPAHGLMPSLLTLSDVMGTGHHAALRANVPPGTVAASLVMARWDSAASLPPAPRRSASGNDDPACGADVLR